VCTRFLLMQNVFKGTEWCDMIPDCGDFASKPKGDLSFQMGLLTDWRHLITDQLKECLGESFLILLEEVAIDRMSPSRLISP